MKVHAFVAGVLGMFGFVGYVEAGVKNAWYYSEAIDNKGWKALNILDLQRTKGSDTSKFIIEFDDSETEPTLVVAASGKSIWVELCEYDKNGDLEAKGKRIAKYEDDVAQAIGNDAYILVMTLGKVKGQRMYIEIQNQENRDKRMWIK